jgi:thiol-disulfide isomerase/thioredoxin
MKFWLPLIILVSLAAGQQTDPKAEEKELNQALAEAGNSQVDFVRALENHLAKYPDSTKKPEMERALARASIELKDDRRIILYGGWVLDHEAGDAQILDRVTRALLSSDSKEASARALEYAKRYVDQVVALRKEPPAGRFGATDWKTEIDRSAARAMALEARATGNLGKYQEALALSEKGYGEFPTAEGAREIAKWLIKLGREADAVPHLADAFTISDSHNTDAARAQDRIHVGELYKKLNGSEKGLGDLILESYDRTTALVAGRKWQAGASDPNAQAVSLMDFTLPGLDNGSLKLASLKGKTIVFDFWATWCGPCRAQHPLIELVKRRFEGNPDVSFVSVNADEDRELVQPFLKDNQWSTSVYFEDGLTRLLQITSIPTTLIVDKRGEIASRMNGFNPDRFADLLTERIQQTLKD